ncbi:MAG TPA: hypothetical protein VEZ42_09780 [Pseudonocardia sp.]|nr:hypothetical protein [Pseudonocardia sp.]
MTRPAPGADPAALAAAALRAAAAAVGGLTPAQLADLAAGRARLVFEPVDRADPAPGRRPGSALRDPDPEVVGSAVRAIRDLHTPDEVAEHLRQGNYPVPVLRQIARGLGPTVSTAARNRAGLERDIVEGTAGYRTRSAAMSGGAWS